MNLPDAEGVLITGVYGAGKSSVAAEIAYLLEKRRRPFAFVDVDFLGWGGADFGADSHDHGLTLINLAAVMANYREAGVGLFVLAYFVSDADVLRRVRAAAACRCGWSAWSCRCPISGSAWPPT